MSDTISLEELAFKEGKIVDNHENEVQVMLVGVPVILTVNHKGRREEVNNDSEEIIHKEAPENADAYLKGERQGAPVVRAPYWAYLPVQYLRKVSRQE